MLSLIDDTESSGYGDAGIPYSDNRRGQSLAIVTGVFMILCTIVMVLRCITIWVQRRPLYLDDYFAAVSYACSTALSGTCIWGVANGLGAYSYELNDKQTAVQAKLVFSSYFTWTFGTCFCKLTVLALCHRIFVARRYRITAYVLGISCIIYVIIFFPIFMTNCTPPDAAWDPSKGTCRSSFGSEYASVSLNIVLDLAVVMLPIWATWGLQMPWRKKIGVMALFSLGLFVIGIMAWRIESTWENASGRQPDGIYQEYNTSLQSMLEIWGGFIAGSLPTLTPLISRWIVPMMRKCGWHLSNFTRKSFKGQSRSGTRTRVGKNTRDSTLSDYSL